MNIGIWDMQYYKTKKGFVVDLMKLSSYHKQLGDSVALIETELDLRRRYDLLYIYKANTNLASPPPSMMYSNKVKLMGEGFKYFNTWKVNDIILACRPDYLLYPSKSTREERADIVQFCNHEGRWLGLRQNPENSFSKKETLIADDAIWIASPETINDCLDEMLRMQNLSFLNPILLSSVLSDETIRKKFESLKLFSGCKLNFINDYGQDYSSALVIVDFIKNLRHNNPTFTSPIIYFEPITNRHNSNEDGCRDFERCLKIIDLGKKERVRLVIGKVDRLKTPYYCLFEELEKWSSNKGWWQDSLIEFMTKKQRVKFQCSVEKLMSEHMWWNDEVFYAMMRTFKAHPMWLDQYGFRQTGESYYSKTTVNWKEIEENIL